MSARGIYNKDGEVVGYLKHERTYDPDGNQTGWVRGRTVYDLDDERHWLLEADAVLDLHGNVIGYLGEPVPHDEW
jgi:hypothetical protein